VKEPDSTQRSPSSPAQEPEVTDTEPDVADTEPEVTDTEPEVSDTQPTADALVMRGGAVGPLRLGMTRAQAEATGLLALPGEGGPCRQYRGKRGIEEVTIGPRGVATIEVSPFIPTPEGVAVGDGYRDVRAAYPSAIPRDPAGEDEFRVPVPGSSTASYLFAFDPNQSGGVSASTGRVTSVYLEDTDRACS